MTVYELPKMKTQIETVISCKKYRYDLNDSNCVKMTCINYKNDKWVIIIKKEE